MLYLMRKLIDVEKSEVLYDKPFDGISLKTEWKVYGGEWWVEDGWLTGKNPLNQPGMIIAKKEYPFDVMLEFEARTVLPSTHDIDFMWNGSWDEEKNERGVAYVAGLEGWWQGKAGMEKSPEYKLNAATPLFDFTPGSIYRIQVGSINGHLFLYVDGRLVLELTDPDPIDPTKYSRIGFEAYSSIIQIRNLKIRKLSWQEIDMKYDPEF